MSDRKLTKEEYELIMDHVSDIYDVISEIKGRLSEIYDSAGEICNIVKCAKEVDNTNFKLKEALKEAEKIISEVMDWRDDKEFYKDLADDFYCYWYANHLEDLVKDDS